MLQCLCQYQRKYFSIKLKSDKIIMTGVAFYEFGERESTKARLDLSRVDKENQNEACACS